MRIIKFSINENTYETFQNICRLENITVKKKLNVLLSKDNPEGIDIKECFPEDANQNLRRITLKVNEELYKGIMKNSDKFDIKPKSYIPYLIYNFLND